MAAEGLERRYSITATAEKECVGQSDRRTLNWLPGPFRWPRSPVDQGRSAALDPTERSD
jgi:hypothetical protein